MILAALPSFMETLAETEIGRILATVLIAMVPVVELRGAIPIGVFTFGLHPLSAAMLAAVGNMLPVPFIILFIRRILAWMKKIGGFLGKIAVWLEKRAENKSSALQKGEFWGLMIFVAIPLPGTGAWTGALIAAMLKMRLKTAVPSILLGVLVAGILVTGITVGFTHLLD